MRRLIAVLLLLAAYGSLGQQVTEKTASGHAYRCTAVTSGKLVKRAWPNIPPEVTAKAIAEGVVLELTIDKEGMPKDIKVKKGDPTLAKAVLEAVQQWRYKPYKLNGEPVEVESTVYIRFCY